MTTDWFKKNITKKPLHEKPSNQNPVLLELEELAIEATKRLNKELFKKLLQEHPMYHILKHENE